MTIVNRRTFVAKRGHLDEVIAILNAEKTDLVKRLYRSHYGAVNLAVMELEFASVAEMEERWEQWHQSEHAQSFTPRWREITESGGTNEVWILE